MYDGIYGLGDFVSKMDVVGYQMIYFVYDVYGNLIFIQNVVGVKLMQVFDVWGCLIDLLDSVGYYVYYSYDGFGRVLIEIYYDDLLYISVGGVDWVMQMMYIYFVGGVVKLSINGFGQVMEYEYDKGGCLICKLVINVRQVDGLFMML